MDDIRSSSLLNWRFISRYLVMIPLYAATIVFAVLVGVTGNIVPPESKWFRTDFPIGTFLITLNIYLVTIPLFIILILNSLWFGHQFYAQRYSAFELATKTLVAVVFALPIIVIAFHIYIAPNLIWGLFGMIIESSITFWVALLIYLLGITGLASKGMSHHVKSRLSNPRFWASFVLVSVILLFTTAALIYPIIKGYFHYFPTIEVFWLTLPDFIVRTLMIAMVLPALPVVFLRLKTD
ncbi:MAG: hypothetical protein RTU92_01820 [Candidatus Thorarchaeota archaeon]